MSKTREELVKTVEESRKQVSEFYEKYQRLLAESPAKPDYWDQYLKAGQASVDAQSALEMFDLRAKAKARLMVKLLVSAFSAVDSASIGHARIMASTAVDAMTDDEVLAVEW